MKFDELLYMTKSIYQNTVEPVALTDSKLNVCWANVEAVKRFPMLSLQDGIIELINGYEVSNVLQILQSGRTFLARKLSEPFNEVSIRIIPIIDENELIGCQAIFLYDGVGTGNFTDQQPEQMLAAFSNEYKMPLTVIFTTLSLMARHLEETADEISQSYVKLITQNCYRLLRLSNNLTEVSRYRAGIAKLNLKKGDLTAFIYSLCEAAMILTRTIGIPLECVLPEKKIITVFDPEKLSLAFYNLISNSCKYTREGNRILVKLEEQGEKAAISVSDRGQGIKSDIIDKVFEPYFSYKTENTISGAGLGLTIVKYIVTQHRGTIALQSEEGVGTTVAFSLPIKQDDSVPDYAAQNGADYLANRFSSLYVQLSDICGCPLP